MRSVVELLATTSILRSFGHRMVRLPEGWGRREVEGGMSVVKTIVIVRRSVKGVAVHRE